MWEKYKKIFRKILFKNFEKNKKFLDQNILGVKHFKSLLISIPKCIELNSELILVLGFCLGPQVTRGTDPIYPFFGAKVRWYFKI